MNNAEARAILKRELQGYRSRPYAELVELIGHDANTEVRGDSGATYQVEIQVFWDGRSHGDVRVLGSIDDGG